MKYRGSDGWIHKEDEERPRRYENTENLNPLGRPPQKNDPCFYLFFAACAIFLILALCVVGGIVRKTLEFLWG